MEESTAIWLLGLAHAQCEALQIECAEVRSHLSVERDRLRAECDKLRDAHRAMLEERIALRTARDDAGAERDALRAELDTLRTAAPAPTVGAFGALVKSEQMRAQGTAFDELQAARKENARLRGELAVAESLRSELIESDARANAAIARALAAESLALQLSTEVNALRAAADGQVNGGWIKVGDTLYVHPDGRAMFYHSRSSRRWTAWCGKTNDWQRGASAETLAGKMEWFDFPGVTAPATEPSPAPES